MTTRPFKLALIQMSVAPGKGRQNLDHALELIRAAAKQKADVVLLPEALPFGWMDTSAKEQATGIPDGVDCRRLREIARELGLFICSGLVERAGDQLFNS